MIFWFKYYASRIRNNNRNAFSGLPTPQVIPNGQLQTPVTIFSFIILADIRQAELVTYIREQSSW